MDSNMEGQGLLLNLTTIFSYDHNGQPGSVLTPDLTKLRVDTGIVAMDCKIVRVKSGKKGQADAVARISIVNNYGYCLYDKFVIPAQPVVDYKTESSGIRKNDLKNATPLSVVTEQVRALLADHILVGLGINDNLRLLKIIHPKNLKREISKYVRNKVGNVSNKKLSLSVLAKMGLNFDMKQDTPSSITDAQVIMMLYRKYKKEWEKSIKKSNGGVDVLMNTTNKFNKINEVVPGTDNTHSQSLVDAKYQTMISENSRNPIVQTISKPACNGHNAQTNFKHNQNGVVVLAPEPEQSKLDTGILGLDCKIVVVKPDSDMTQIGGTSVARVSIVNEQGYCLFDKYVVLTRSGVQTQDLVPVDEVRNLLANHILVGLNLNESLRNLEIIHPKILKRELSRFVRNKLGGIPAPLGMNKFVKAAYGKDLEKGEQCSIENAKAAIALYKTFQDEWESSVTQTAGMNVLQTTIDHFKNLNAQAIARVVLSSSSLSNHSPVPAKRELNQLTNFQSDHNGQLRNSQNPHYKDQMLDTGIVSVACKFIGIGPKCLNSVGRISVVNEFGYCLYDKFIKPSKKGIVDYKTSVTGIKAEDIGNADPRATVAIEIEAILEGHVVICHGAEWLPLVGYSHPQKCRRDTEKYLRSKLGFSEKVNLAAVVKTELGVDLLQDQPNSIKDAQAVMRLYLKHQTEWEESIRKCNGGVDMLADTLNDLKRVNPSVNGNINSAKHPTNLNTQCAVKSQLQETIAKSIPVSSISQSQPQCEKLLTIYERSRLRRRDTGIVSISCKLIGLGPHRLCALGRVYVLNKKGHLLYDEFIRPSKRQTMIDCRTATSGIEMEDLADGEPLATVISDLRRLLQHHILIGYGLKDILKLLKNPHPVKCRRDIHKYKPLPSNDGIDLAGLLKKKAEDVLKRDPSSTYDAEMAMTLYLLYQKEWEESIKNSNHGIDILRNTLDNFKRLNSDNLDIEPPPYNALTRFEYDHYGKRFSPETLTSAHKRFMGFTNAVGIDCEMVGIGPPSHHALGRVSIVNEYGFCLYDKFVKPDCPVLDYRTPYSGLRESDLRNATPNDVVVEEVKNILRGRIVVGHRMKDDLKVLQLSSLELNLRDTSPYYQKKLERSQPPGLRNLIDHYFDLDIQSAEHSSIEDAQAAMALYQLEKDKWEKSLGQIQITKESASVEDNLVRAFNKLLQTSGKPVSSTSSTHRL